jgi:hypothetical protein
MTTKDFKRLIHERQAKTGESYSIARMHLLRAAGSPTTGAAAPAVVLWTSAWMLGAKDIAPDVLTALYDDLVDHVHSDEYDVGYTEFEDLVFRNVDDESGTAEFHVRFTAEHPSEDFDLDGHVQGQLAFGTDEEDEDEDGGEDDDLEDDDKKERFLESLRLMQVEVHFDMGDPD